MLSDENAIIVTTFPFLSGLCVLFCNCGGGCGWVTSVLLRVLIIDPAALFLYILLFASNCFNSIYLTYWSSLACIYHLIVWWEVPLAMLSIPFNYRITSLIIDLWCRSIIGSIYSKLFILIFICGIYIIVLLRLS